MQPKAVFPPTRPLIDDVKEEVKWSNLQAKCKDWETVDDLALLTVRGVREHYESKQRQVLGMVARRDAIRANYFADHIAIEGRPPTQFLANGVDEQIATEVERMLLELQKTCLSMQRYSVQASYMMQCFATDDWFKKFDMWKCKSEVAYELLIQSFECFLKIKGFLLDKNDDLYWNKVVQRWCTTMTDHLNSLTDVVVTSCLPSKMAQLAEEDYELFRLKMMATLEQYYGFFVM